MAVSKTTEVEIKFKLSERTSKLLAAELFASELPKLTESAYFDTPENLLQQNGLELRLRKAGKGYRQTIKALPAAPRAFSRTEIESDVSSDLPDPGPLSRLLKKAKPQACTLQPIFETRFKRWKNTLQSPSNRGAIEACLDVGEVRAQDKKERIRELELELKGGSISDLYGVALNLASKYDLTLLFDGKADRGYRLCTDKEIKAWKPKKHGLDPDLNIVDAATESLRQAYTHFARNITPVVEIGHPDSIHQMRVGIRRLRTIAFVFSQFTALNSSGSPLSEMRGLFAQLGRIREMDVFMKDVAPETNGLLSEKQWGTIEQAIVRNRDGKMKTLRKRLTTSQFTSEVLQLGHWIEQKKWIDASNANSRTLMELNVKQFAEARLPELYDELISRRRLIRDGEHSEWHRLRIQTKKLRYASEFFSSAFHQTKSKAFIRRLSSWQDRLGRLNDIATAAKFLKRISREEQGKARKDIAKSSLMVAGWAHAVLSREEPELAKHWQVFEQASPFWTK